MKLSVKFALAVRGGTATMVHARKKCDTRVEHSQRLATTHTHGPDPDRSNEFYGRGVWCRGPDAYESWFTIIGSRKTANVYNGIRVPFVILGTDISFC